MQHFTKITQDETPEDDAITLPEFSAPHMQDRAEIRLTNFIGTLFSIGSFACLVALALLALFFTQIVAQSGEIGMILILGALGASFVFGMLLLDFTHARALAGYRAARERNARRSRAIAGAILCLFLAMVHPLMALAILISSGLGLLGHFVLSRFFRSEPAWDFLSKEAISILSGRDKIGFQMTTQRAPVHMMARPVSRAGTAFSVLISMACGSYLVAEGIMSMSALVPLVIGSFWASYEILDFIEGRLSRADPDIMPAASVEPINVEQDDDKLGLSIHNLTLLRPGTAPILSDVTLDVEPGQITGVIGDSGAGKSVLFQAIADPFSLSGVAVSGHVRMGRSDLWLRQSAAQSVPAVLVPAEPLLVAASGADNLTCFHDGEMLSRGRWFLEQLVFAVDMVEAICDAPDARTLPTMQRKALALARAFTLGSPLYLLDQPEDGLPEKQIGALVHRLKQEARMGRSVLLATHSRTVLEACDRLIVLQHGRIVDYGDAAEVRARMDSGWSRFKGMRLPQTEEVLVNWVRSHFFRNGDEANRRKVAAIASDLLAFSNQSADARAPGQVQFTFKHFKGHCLLRMRDGDPPIANSAVQKAEREAQSDQDQTKISLLAGILRAAIEVECSTQQDDRQITVKIETYDPRKTGPIEHVH